MKNLNLLLSILLLSSFQLITAQDYSATKIFGQNELAVREVRRNAIALNIGWNALTGVGFTYHNYLAKQMGIDLGVGLSSTGIKFGGRFRYLFTPKNFSPYLSAGFNYGLGTGAFEYNSPDEDNEYKYTIGSSPFAQITGGLEYLSNKGFLFQFDLGYAILLTDSNYEITEGTPNSNSQRALDLVLGSGIVFELTFGYAFGGN